MIQVLNVIKHSNSFFSKIIFILYHCHLYFLKNFTSYCIILFFRIFSNVKKNLFNVFIIKNIALKYAFNYFLIIDLSFSNISDIILIFNFTKTFWLEIIFRLYIILYYTQSYILNLEIRCNIKYTFIYIIISLNLKDIWILMDSLKDKIKNL